MTTDLEQLQEHTNGITLEYTISALFPTEYSQSGYDEMANMCLKVATDLYNYYNSFRDEPYKGYTYVCGPPTSEAEIPRLGLSVQTPHGLRTIKSINYSYQDGQSYVVNIEVGPAMISSAGVGQIYKKQTDTTTVIGTVVREIEGALYKVNIPGLGLINAYNVAKWPHEIGDRVHVQLFNVPKEA